MRLTFKDTYEFTWTGGDELPPEDELERKLSYLSIHQSYGRTLQYIEDVVYLPQRRMAEAAQKAWEAHVASGAPNIIDLSGCDVAGSRGGYARY